MNFIWLCVLLFMTISHAGRQKRFLFGQSGCETVIRCLGAGNVIFPYRLNFNPITAYDRITSHIQGRNGWSRGEVRHFDRQQNAILRLKKRQELRRQLHRQRVQFLRRGRALY